jgi:hypothetical protein
VGFSAYAVGLHDLPCQGMLMCYRLDVKERSSVVNRIWAHLPGLT